MTDSIDRIRIRAREKALEESEWARQLRRSELWKEAWTAVNATPPSLSWMSSRPSSEPFGSIELISPLSTPTTSPSVPTLLKYELTKCRKSWWARYFKWIPLHNHPSQINFPHLQHHPSPRTIHKVSYRYPGSKIAHGHTTQRRKRELQGDPINHTCTCEFPPPSTLFSCLLLPGDWKGGLAIFVAITRLPISDP